MTRATVRYVAPLAAFRRDDVEWAGGKGANLGELVRGGFPVPPGFVVTTAAYDLLLEGTGLGSRIPALLSRQPEGSAIQEALISASMPAELRSEVLASFADLGAGSVAVRSSATAEDLPEAAFAGQQETYLNVVGEEALLVAVRRCWASLWTDRAIAYRRRLGLEPTAARIAVVVQLMVAAQTAGVLFTANPVTGARDEVVIDASPGLGEAVVSGQVTPDHFVIDRRSARVKEWRPGRREVVVQPRLGGGTEHADLPARDEKVASSLPDHALRRLVRLGTAIQKYFGKPQDVEWAWADGDAFILQARPITALPEPPPRAGRLRRAMAHMAAELLPKRPYPLDATTWSSGLAEAAVAVLARLGIARPSFEQICIEENGVVVRLRLPAIRPRPSTLLVPVRLLRQAWLYDPLRWEADPLLTELRVRARALEGRDLTSLAWHELLGTLREALGLLPLIGELRTRYLPRPALAAGVLRLTLSLLRLGDRFGALLSHVETKTTETNRALETLAGQIRSDSGLSELFATERPAGLLKALETNPSSFPFLHDLRVFLDRYGHRETVTLLATEPTWKDAPEVVLGVLKGFAASPPPPERRSSGKAALGDLLAHPLLRFPPLRLAILKLVQQARLLLQIREDTHFYATLPLPTAHRILVEFGRRLAAAGVLDTPPDVFHLKLAELERVDASWPPAPVLARWLRATAQQRKATRAALADTPLLDPRWLGGPAEARGDVLLRGTPASPGVASGPARVVLTVAEFGALKSGDVLIAPYTNPAWTPLFQRAAAVVVDSGGPASHAAIVAREYGIPAVMATGDGTRRLTDNQSVQVDGNRGIVSPAREELGRPDAKTAAR
jgi:phosphohistidine swiveling domain-containing protein